MSKYRVYMRSTGGFYEQYEGYVDVRVSEDDSLFMAAVRELKRTAFPDRSSDCWRLISSERLD
jgi:hypothetical protein